MDPHHRLDLGPGLGALMFLARKLVARLAGEGGFEVMALDGSLLDYLPYSMVGIDSESKGLGLHV